MHFKGRILQWRTTAQIHRFGVIQRSSAAVTQHTHLRGDLWYFAASRWQLEMGVWMMSWFTKGTIPTPFLQLQTAATDWWYVGFAPNQNPVPFRETKKLELQDVCIL